MLNKNRVLFVIPYMHEGGAQRALSNIQNEMGKLDDIEIETLVNSEINRAYPNTGRVISLHIDKKPRTGSVVFQFFAFIKRVRKLIELKNSGIYSSCVSFVDSANIANIISTRLARRSSVKTIVSVRTSISEEASRFPQYRYIIMPLAKHLYKEADMIVSVSEELRNELISDFELDESRVVTISNGFNLADIRNRSKEDIDDNIRAILNGKKVIFTAGRLNIAKDQWHLIRAFSRVRQSVSNAVLLIAGTGELKDYLTELTRQAEVEDVVLFLGFEDNIYKYMSVSDVFVLPSGLEGYPNALCEALCVGVPCIATDFKTGAREIIAPDLLFENVRIDKYTLCEYGIITPVCSGKMYRGDEPLEMAEIELADALIKVLNDRELDLHYRDKSLERSRSLDIDSLTKKWVSIVR